MRRLTLIATLVAVIAPAPALAHPVKPRHPVAHTARSSWS
jgi:hypothetical protein